MQNKNGNKKFPIIDNILILGLKSEELNSIQSSNINNIEENLSKYKPAILSDYSLFNKTANPQKEEFYKSICQYSFPDGTIISSENINFNKRQYITFCIKDFNGHLKHITCSYIQFGLKIKDGNIVNINSGIALVSFLDIYECHKEILLSIINIIVNYFNSNGNSNNKKMRQIFCGNQILEEYRLLPFYFSFLLNLTLDDYYNLEKIKNICLLNIPNNYFQNIFCKISLNPKNKNSILSLKEFDTSIILDKFYIEDIVKLYYALLLDKSIIFLFNDYSEINIIINSLLSITFPMDKMKKYNIKYVYNKPEIQSKKIIKKDQLNIIYLIYYTEDDDLSFLPEEGKTPSIASSKNTNISSNNENSNNLNENSFYYSCLNFYYYKDTFVYSIKEKKFLNCPLDFEKNNKTIFIEDEINDEIKGQLYFTMGEKLVVNSNMNFDDTDLGLIFDNSTCNKINTFLYFNLKIKSIFFKCFLMIINGINSLINFNYKFNKDNFSITEFFDVKNKFVRENRIKYYLIKNKNFHQFLVNYIKKYKNNEKYMFIYKSLNEIKDKNFVEINKYFENVFKEQIKNGIINYYNFDYINMEKCFNDLLDSFKNDSNINKNNIDNYLLNSSKNYTFYQLLNIDQKKIQNNNSFFSKHSYKGFLETDISQLNKFQLYKIYKLFKLDHNKSNKEINKLYLLKPPSPHIYKAPNLYYYNNLNLNKNEKKAQNISNQKNIISNIDNIFGKILKIDNFKIKKKELINKDPNQEINSDSKKLKSKKINKDPSPSSKAKFQGNQVDRNTSNFNFFNHPFLKNTSQKNKRKNLQLSNIKEIKNSNKSFREKNNLSKSKNNIIKNNALIEIDSQMDNSRESIKKRKYTYNLEESNQTLKKYGLNKNANSHNNASNNKRIIKDKIEKKVYGPINSSKKYENNFGHIPKLAGDLDDDLVSDED